MTTKSRSRRSRTPTTTGLQCPECGSIETRPSRKKGIVVMLLKVLKFNRFKCNTCGNRFYGSA